MRVLVTGTGGYIGAVMAPLLVRQGHEVVGLDTGYFDDARLGDEREGTVPTIAKDLRHVTAADVAGFDAVVHLAGLSNDALGQLSRRVTYDVNHFCTIHLAALAKQAGVRRFVYSSSCSVYGRSAEAIVNEASRVDPQTDYAVCKMLDEREVSTLADDRFSPVFLRNATAYGASPRMRFDLVVNQLSALARTTGRIAMVSDGTPWRPIVHVLDICGAFRAALEAPREAIHDRVFNVGRTDENYQVRDIAAGVAEAYPGCQVSFGASDPDQRSYRVSFERIAETLPGFRCEWDLGQGVRQLRDLYERVGLDDAKWRARPFTRLAKLTHLLAEGTIDADFFWTRQPAPAPASATVA